MQRRAERERMMPTATLAPGFRRAARIVKGTIVRRTD
jgi:hypothetical protein